MFGGAQKPGRGGGGGGRGIAGGKRNAYAPQNPSRASNGGGGGGGRLSMGGSSLRGRNPPASATAQSSAVDETFSLVARNPLSFAATLRLPPDLVEEIKRVEAQGGVAKIKFDCFPNNPSGNVIDVGGKEFRFTWSREVGDLCDIYEEPQNNDDSNGLLVESGCAYRKLNVQRTLDESTKNHLKKRSEEAERNFRARKTVVLDPSNPSMKNQIKALASADASPWKSFQKTKKEPPFKKRKFESTQGAATPINATAEENVYKPGKVASGKTFPGAPETTDYRVKESSIPVDLQSMLTSMLKDNPNGMTLKALEKSVGDVIPTPSRKIEPVLKIATYQTSGRYILNSEAELGSLKRCSQNGSSPEGNGQQRSVSRERHFDVASHKVAASVEKSSDPHVGEQATLNLIFGEDPDIVEKIEISQNSPEPVGDKNSEGRAARSSDSGSDSDSDSDSSDSDSGSQSRSRSPAESGSGSSSDSDSDSSSNSKEGSDVDVDIMSDDDNEPKHTMQASDQGFPTSPGQWRTPDDRHMENGIVERMDDQQSEDVDIEGDQDIDVGTALDLALNAEEKSTEEFGSTLPNQEEHEKQWTTNMLGEPEEFVAGDMNQENQDRVQRSKDKSKKAPRMKKTEEAFDYGKRLKGGSYAESHASRFEEQVLSGSPHRPPDELNEDQYKDSNLEIEDKCDRDDNVDFASQRDYGYQGPGKMAVDPQQSGRRPTLWSNDSDLQDKSSKHARSDNIHETPGKQKNKMQRGIQDGKGNSHERTNRKAKESGSGNKHTPQPDSLQRKHDQMKKFHPDPNIGLPQQDGNRADAETFPPVTGKNNMLRRELSDLELGELREPVSMELDGNNNNNNQFQRQGSFKQFDTKVGTSDSLNANFNKGKPASKPPTDLRPSSPVKGVRNSSSKRSPSLHDEAFENNVIGMDGYGETHKKAHARRQNDSKQEPATFSGKGTKSQKSNSSAKGASKVRDAFTNDGHNDNRKSESSSDENSSFSKYEKEKPDLKEPVKDLTQYKEYVQEYTEKYSTYCSLNKVLENYRNEFHKMGKDLESAKSKDMTKYYRVLRQLRESYQQHGEKHKRLKKTFVVLHEELKHLKQRIKDFAAAYNKD